MITLLIKINNIHGFTSEPNLASRNVLHLIPKLCIVPICVPYNCILQSYNRSGAVYGLKYMYYPSSWLVKGLAHEGIDFVNMKDHIQWEIPQSMKIIPLTGIMCKS